jgi:hemerythrin-like metal-binding protein
MPHIAWCDTFLTGVREIDEQHEKLTAMINELYYAYMDGKDKDVLSSIIAGVSDYTSYHFAAEERLMHDSGYPLSAEHKKEHQEFIEKSIDFLIAHTRDEAELTSEVLDYLTTWWITHIKGTDRKLTVFLLEKNSQ